MMNRNRIMSAALMAVAATALALAGSATAGGAGAQQVSGSDAFGLVSGSLEGAMTDAPDSFASFMRTRVLTPSGELTWRAPVIFVGCVSGRGCGTLLLEGHAHYRFRPGTSYYDFEQGGYQPGTVGDPAVWLGGSSIYRIAGGTGELEGASGSLVFTETAFLSAHTYRGVINI
jgi:hypothetical protein